MSVGSRIRAKVLNEVRVWGLRAPARVEVSDGTVSLELELPEDQEVAEGFTVAAAAMLAMDLERRCWTGRLHEVAQDLPIEGAAFADFDPYVLKLGFRRDAEQHFKRNLTAPAKARLERYAQGVNAWIDTGRWQRDRRWSDLGTRPRLWGPSDSVLLARSPAAVDTTATDPLAQLLRSEALRAPGAAAGGVVLEPTGKAGVPSTVPLGGPSAAGFAALPEDHPWWIADLAPGDVPLTRLVPLEGGA
ncbi:MAG: penicillin acylase family protein [Proteobacteria bacterium]|nr:penicillin acylase family protein [Pseudomonadota bacterium]